MADEIGWKELSREAFPGRSEEEIVPIGLVFAGIRWGRDFRFLDLPRDDHGMPITGCSTDTPAYRHYLCWLSDYLRQIEGETPNKEQEGLCRYVEKMRPADGMTLIGMNGAIYDFEAEIPWIYLENGDDIETYLSEIDPEDFSEDDPYDEEAAREHFLQVKREFEQKQADDQGGGHADIGYRLPLAKALATVSGKAFRVKLLEAFYSTFFHYAAK